MLKKPPLIIDTCVLSDFISADRFGILIDLYGGNIVIPYEVYQECCEYKPLRERLKSSKDNSWYEIHKIDQIEDLQRYGDLEIRFRGGKGEAAILTLYHKHGGTVCSNNLEDILTYVKKHEIPLKLQ